MDNLIYFWFPVGVAFAIGYGCGRVHANRIWEKALKWGKYK